MALEAAAWSFLLVEVPGFYALDLCNNSFVPDIPLGLSPSPPATVSAAMNGEERMLAACRLQSVDCTPVWFMRQAGRCLAAYRALRERYDILEIAKTPELCA